MDLTIVDVARMVGVSQAAVSRVLNDPGKVKETTRDRVLQVMEENDYVYNALAARKAIAYLVSMGHRRIAFISGNFLASGRAKRR